MCTPPHVCVHVWTTLTESPNTLLYREGSQLWTWNTLNKEEHRPFPVKRSSCRAQEKMTDTIHWKGSIGLYSTACADRLIAEVEHNGPSISIWVTAFQQSLLFFWLGSLRKSNPALPGFQHPLVSNQTQELLTSHTLDTVLQGKCMLFWGK